MKIYSSNGNIYQSIEKYCGPRIVFNENTWVIRSLINFKLKYEQLCEIYLDANREETKHVVAILDELDSVYIPALSISQLAPNVDCGLNGITTNHTDKTFTVICKGIGALIYDKSEKNVYYNDIPCDGENHLTWQIVCMLDDMINSGLSGSELKNMYSRDLHRISLYVIACYNEFIKVMFDIIDIHAENKVNNSRFYVTKSANAINQLIN